MSTVIDSFAFPMRRLLTLFWIFASVSAVSLGGGLVMIPVFTQQFVEKRKWLTHEDMLDTIALTQSLPGLIAINMASLIGYRIAGIPGVLAAALGVTLPPFIAIVAIAFFLLNFFDHPLVQHAFTGIRAGVCAMILLSAISMGKKTLKNAFSCTVAAISFILLLVANVNVIAIIMLAAGAGAIMTGYTVQRAVRKAAGENKP